MIRHVLENQFSRFAKDEYFKNDTKYDKATIKKALRKNWTWLTYRFGHPTKGFTKQDIELREDEGPILCSSSQEIDDWIVDLDLVKGKYTN